MLQSAHKQLLTRLARQHAADLAGNLRHARQTFGEGHTTVQRLVSEFRLASDLVRTLETEPERVAA